MSLDSLPDEWLLTELNQVLTVKNGYAFKSKDYISKKISDDLVSVIRISDIRDNSVSTVKSVFVEKEKASENFKIDKGDLLIAMSGATTGKTGIFHEETSAFLNQRVGNLKVHSAECFLPKFRNFLIQNLSNQILENAYGGAQPNISSKDIESLVFGLPPLAEQQEIVRQLDMMLAQVEQIKARLDAIPAILKKFRQSVLADAVSGKLIEQDFSDLDFLKLESLILDSGNGLSKRKGDSGKEVTVLRLADFKDAQRIIGNERSILLTEKELQKYKLLQNDILVVRVNGSVDIAGKFILHKDNDKNEAYCDHFIRLRIDLQKLLPEYLLYIANEGKGRDYLVSSLSTSAGQNTINQTSIKGLKLRVPEIKYQEMIVQTVEKLFKHSFKIEQEVQSAQKRVNLLTQSILAKAFSGELTAEWREQHQELITGVNSAQSLLAKIQAEREASKPVKKTRVKKDA